MQCGDWSETKTLPRVIQNISAVVNVIVPDCLKLVMKVLMLITEAYKTPNKYISETFIKITTISRNINKYLLLVCFTLVVDTTGLVVYLQNNADTQRQTY